MLKHVVIALLVCFGVALAHPHAEWLVEQARQFERIDPSRASIRGSVAHARDPHRWCDGQITDKYDDIIRKQAESLMPHDPYAYCKAKTVAFVESRLNPRAISPVGAQSLFQMMPGTFKRFASCRDAFDPNCNVKTGIKHLAYLQDFWYLDRTQDCRDNLVWASSNWGEGYVLRQQVVQGDARCITPSWELPDETRQHLRRINTTIKMRKLGVA